MTYCIALPKILNALQLQRYGWCCCAILQNHFLLSAGAFFVEVLVCPMVKLNEHVFKIYFRVWCVLNNFCKFLLRIISHSYRCLLLMFPVQSVHIKTKERKFIFNTFDTVSIFWQYVFRRPLNGNLKPRIRTLKLRGATADCLLLWATREMR